MNKWVMRDVKAVTEDWDVFPVRTSAQVTASFSSHFAFDNYEWDCLFVRGGTDPERVKRQTELPSSQKSNQNNPVFTHKHVV